MKRVVGIVCGVGLLVAIVGCEAAQSVAEAMGGNEVTVTLRNTSDEFDVNVSLYYSEDDDVLEDVLTNLGEHREFNIGPGESATFTPSCDDLQAIIIDDADLEIIGDIDTETRVYRGDGDDFDCGDTLVFTFSHSDLLLDFDVSFTIQ